MREIGIITNKKTGLNPKYHFGSKASFCISVPYLCHDPNESDDNFLTLERVTGIEPVSHPWQGRIIAIILYPHHQNFYIYSMCMLTVF